MLKQKTKRFLIDTPIAPAFDDEDPEETAAMHSKSNRRKGYVASRKRKQMEIKNFYCHTP